MSERRQLNAFGVEPFWATGREVPHNVTPHTPRPCASGEDGSIAVSDPVDESRPVHWFGAR
jgi:hypothetical protein